MRIKALETAKADRDAAWRLREPNRDFRSDAQRAPPPPPPPGPDVVDFQHVFS